MGCGIKHHADCECRDTYGGHRVGAGRPWEALSAHEYKVEMQKRRVRQTVRRLQKLETDFETKQAQLHLTLAIEAETLESLQRGDDVEIGEAPPLRKPCPDGISLEALGRVCVSLRVPGYGVALKDIPGASSDWGDMLTGRTAMLLVFAKLKVVDEVKPYLDGVKLPENFENTKSGVPYRQFCKEPMWLYKEAQRYLSCGICRDTVLNIFLLVILFRGWFNRHDHFTDFLGFYGMPLAAGSFNLDQVKAAAKKPLKQKKGDDKKRRGAAYNPGSYGAKGQELPEHKLFERWVELIWPELQSLVDKFVSLCRGFGPATKDTSLWTLALLRSWLGPFVALQCALDLELLLPQLFRGDLALDVGPGAVTVLFSLFEGLGQHGGMVRQRSAQLAQIQRVYAECPGVKYPHGWKRLQDLVNPLHSRFRGNIMDIIAAMIIDRVPLRPPGAIEAPSAAGAPSPEVEALRRELQTQKLLTSSLEAKLDAQDSRLKEQASRTAREFASCQRHPTQTRYRCNKCGKTLFTMDQPPTECHGCHQRHTFRPAPSKEGKRKFPLSPSSSSSESGSYSSYEGVPIAVDTSRSRSSPHREACRGRKPALSKAAKKPNERVSKMTAVKKKARPPPTGHPSVPKESSARASSSAKEDPTPPAPTIHIPEEPKESKTKAMEEKMRKEAQEGLRAITSPLTPAAGPPGKQGSRSPSPMSPRVVRRSGMDKISVSLSPTSERANAVDNDEVTPSEDAKVF